jgi:hypothetical protein
MKYLLIAILFVSQLACVDKNNTKEIDPETVATNPDWTEASHSNDV